MSRRLLLSILSIEDRVRLHRIIPTSITIRRQRTRNINIMIVNYRDEKMTLITMNHCRIQYYDDINPFSIDAGLIFFIGRGYDEDHVDKIVIRVEDDEIYAIETIHSDERGYIEDQYRLMKIDNDHYKMSVEYEEHEEHRRYPNDIIRIGDDVITCYLEGRYIIVNDCKGYSIYDKISQKITHHPSREYYSNHLRTKAIDTMKMLYNIE